MASFSASAATILAVLLLLLLRGFADGNGGAKTLPTCDVDRLEFALNLEYLEAEFFSWGAMGVGLDKLSPNLAHGGPCPVGGKQANLSPLIKDIVTQFAYEEIGHLRAIQKTVKGFPRPLMNISAEVFGDLMNKAFEKPLNPPFDPYCSDLNFLIASYVIPYVGLTAYVGANPYLETPLSKQLVAGLLGVESGQDAVIRTLLYEHAKETVKPYKYTVAEFTKAISTLRNKLGNKGVKDEGIIVEARHGAEGKVSGNVLAGDEFSLSYGRTPEEVLRIIYGTGNEACPGGFYPKGADGHIAKSFVRHGGAPVPAPAINIPTFY